MKLSVVFTLGAMCCAAVLLQPDNAPSQTSNVADSGFISDLPVFEVPAKTPGKIGAIFMTGDGGWATLDRRVVEELTQHGIPVAVLNSRSYLSHRKTPDDLGRDLTRLSRHFMAKWQSDSIIIAGYSRGADFAPFGVSRMPSDVRGRVALVAMLGLATRAGFEFHFIDLIAAPHRPTDVETVPELIKLKGMRMLCVYGKDEKDSACPVAPPGLMQVVSTPGGHHFDDDFAHLGQLIVAAVR
ncbi:MAG TPA: AcvB/VirJ family lysyl-phosphatidylglycerol hydrolase [Gemmatimonadaceae bacterium]|nr:AcvB/VirJ family lysyl-phosphatidylglycerol hydrolase [Gemmatimonadaceae bacterium]